MNPWRNFELLVSRIEASLVPHGAVVCSPDRIQDKITGQLREVDASIKYQIGTTPILVTIECRDRSKVQDDTWIEQLVTKKQKIGAAATLAVSSQGFSKPAAITAAQHGIQLRTLTESTGVEVSSWANELNIDMRYQEWRFTRLDIQVSNVPTPATISAATSSRIEALGYAAPIGFRRNDRLPLTLFDIGSMFLEKALYPPTYPIKVFGDIVMPDYEVLVQTSHGEALLSKISVAIEISNVVRPTPLIKTFEYSEINGLIYRIADYEYRSPSGALFVTVVQN